MQKFTLKRLGGIAMLAVVASLAAAPAMALAQDALSNPSASEYEPQSQVQGTSKTGSQPQTGQQQPQGAAAQHATSPTGLNSNVGSLPFTGMDVIVLVVVAGALIGTGFALRRLSAPKTQV